MQKISAGKFHGEPPFTSFDHLVGDGEQPGRKAEAEYLGGVEVDHELELGRLHDRQIGGLLALENPASVDTGLAICVGKARSVAHQTASFHILAPGIDRRHLMVRRQRNELYATVEEQQGGTDQERINRLCARLAETVSMSRSVLAWRTSIRFPMAKAAAWTPETKGSVRGKLGSTSTAMRAALGRNSCKSPSCFAPSCAEIQVTPVMLLPGRLRLATRPSL